MITFRHLHMHVISTDFVSNSLKKAEHWNAFNTDFFLPVKVVMEQLDSNGMIDEIDRAKMRSLLKSPLKCRFCQTIFTSLPSLKDHLLMHKPT